MQLHNQQIRRAQISTLSRPVAGGGGLELIAHYDFNTDGQANDIVGGYDGTFVTTGSATIANGLFNCTSTALGNYIDLPNTMLTGAGDPLFLANYSAGNHVPITFSYWYRKTANDWDRTGPMWFTQNSNPLKVHAYYGALNTSTSLSVGTMNGFVRNRWAHVVLTWDFDSGTYAGYLDNTSKFSTSFNPAAVWFSTAGNRRIFGRQFTAESVRGPGGYFDDFKILHGVAGASDVQSLWDERPDLQLLTGANP